MTYSDLALEWNPRSKTSRRFLMLASAVVVLMMAAGFLISMITVPPVERQARVDVPDRIAKFILDKPKPKQKPRPMKKPEPVKKPEAKKEEKPKVKKPVKKDKKKPLTNTQKDARKKAEKSGILALADQLEGLMDTSEASAMLGGSIESTSSSAKKASSGNSSQELILADAGKGSGGVSDRVFSTKIAAKSQLSKRDITRVRQSLVATETVAKVDSSKTSSISRNKAPRSGIRGEEEITIVFDQNKSKLFSIYNRERRKNPSLKGRIVLQITVAPSGKVSKIVIVSSELNDPKLERRLLSRIKQFNFGARNVEEITITYPIEFLPG